MEKVSFFGFEVNPSNGGLPKTMRKFRDALGGEIFSFNKSSNDADKFDDVTYLKTGPGPLLEWYGYSREVYENPVFKRIVTSELLSCHVMLRYHANFVMKISQKYRIPYLFVPHGQLDPYVFSYRSFVKRLWMKLYGSSLLQNAACVVFATEREYEKSKWIYKGDNFKIIHWPTEVNSNLFKMEKHRQICSSLRIPNDSKIVIYLGRLHSMKRPLETIDLFGKYASNNVHLLVVGPEGNITVSDCRRRASAFKNIHVLGPAYGKNKDDLLVGADFFVSFSARENFGHTVAESLSSETPVLLSPGNDLALDLKSYNCGLFLDTDSVEDRIRGIKFINSVDAKTIHSMGIRGRQFVTRNLEFSIFKDKLEELKSSILN